LGITNFFQGYAIHALIVTPGSLPAGRALAWVSNWIWPIPIAILPFLFLLFPSGHPRSRGWRPVGWIAAASLGLLMSASIIFATSDWADPFAGPGPTAMNGAVVNVAEALFIAGLVTILVAMLTSVVSLLVRFRGSVGEERLQLKWFVTAAALVAIAFVPNFISNWGLASMLFSLALLFMYAAIANAVVKYRLYDIDVVISKTVVFASLVAFITAVYLGLVIGIGTLVGNRRSPVLSAIGAAVVAVAFQPVRLRARHLANRLVYGERATPYEVLSEFSERAAGTYSSEDVLPRMVRVLSAGTGATEARVWLRVGSELRAAASWPEDGVVPPVRINGDDLPGFPGHDHAFPVRHGGELLGAITVATRASDPLTPDQRKLLTDVAAQTGLLLRNVRLVEELRESRRRIVTAQDARAKALERNIHDGAQQQLVALAVKLRLAEQLTERDA